MAYVDKQSKAQQEKKEAFKQLNKDIRRVSGHWTKETSAFIEKCIYETPDIPITSRWIRGAIDAGNNLEVDCGNGYGTVTVTKEGFKGGIQVSEVTVWIGGGYAFRMYFKDRSLIVI